MNDLAAGRDRGFTLLEVLIALAILGLSLTVLFNLFGNSLNLAREGETEAAAAALAQSLLERLGPETPIRDGDLTGKTADDLRWRLHVEPYGNEQDRAAWPIAAKTVSATVTWSSVLGDRSLTLATLRLAPQEDSR